MTESATDSKPIAPVLDLVKTIGEYRDAVLVQASTAYLLGYLSWAFYAAQNDLGLVPALDAQYFVAGVLPTIILAVGVGLAVAQLRFSRWSAADPSPARYRWATRLVKLAFTLVVGGSFVGYFLNGRAENIAVGVAVGGTYLLMAGSLLQGSQGDALLKGFGKVVLWFVVAFIPVVMLLAYFEKVFPYLPAAIGGPSPRCVVIDLSTKELSSRTLTTLLANDTASAAPPSESPDVERTKPLDLLFASPEFAMLRVRDEGAHGAVYSVAKHAIQALAPCPADTAPNR